MTKIKQKEFETRQKYLVRVAIAMLEENAYLMEVIKYDDAVCDALCLANDLKIEFDINN
jgi:hypothetical protein